MGEQGHEQVVVGWAEVTVLARAVAATIRETTRDIEAGPVEGIYGIPRGGCVPAALIAGMTEIPLVEAPGPTVFVVDDLVDSGRTAKDVLSGYPQVAGFRALYCKSWSPPDLTAGAVVTPGDPWLVFPWEAREMAAQDAVVRLMQAGGVDTTDPGVEPVAAALAGVLPSHVASLVGAWPGVAIQ
jgi:xanthine phosphoribosyltransferase